MGEMLYDGVATESGERSTEDLDKLADSTETSRNAQRPMAEKDAAKAEKPAEETFEFDHGGKKVKGTRDQVIKWAQMGYDRPQFMQKFNQEKTQWDTQRQTWEKQWGQYKQIDDFAKQNADWWRFIQDQWNNRGNRANPAPQPGTEIGNGVQPVPGNDPYASKFQSLEQKLSQFEQFAQEFQQDKVSAKEKQEDQVLEEEIQSIRTMHKDLDWDTPDENGKSLELKVLEHAQATGIRSFRAAARDLLYDQLVGRAESQAKINVAKGIVNRTKMGVLGESPTPKTWQPQSTKNIRQTSYEELESEIREELRQGKR